MKNKMKKLIRKIKIAVMRINSYRNIEKKYRKNPVDMYAFIRVKNEINTVQTCLESILPYISKGVIGYHKLSLGEVDDGTEEYIKEFCKKNKGFKLFKYNYEVYPANHEKYKKLESIPKENRLDTYYNAVLSEIPKGKWLVKIDCDHVYETEKLKNIAFLPKKESDIIKFSRMNLHFENNELFVIEKNSIYEPGDHWLLKNENIYFDYSTGYQPNYDIGDYQNIRFYFYETLKFESFRKMYWTNLFNWHFPMIKNSRNFTYMNKENLTRFSNYKFSIFQKIFYGISKDMINEKKILEICKKFK